MLTDSRGDALASVLSTISAPKPSPLLSWMVP
jgi:hypothetical protein